MAYIKLNQPKKKELINDENITGDKSHIRGGDKKMKEEAKEWIEELGFEGYKIWEDYLEAASKESPEKCKELILAIKQARERIAEKKEKETEEVKRIRLNNTVVITTRDKAFRDNSAYQHMICWEDDREAKRRVQEKHSIKWINTDIGALFGKKEPFSRNSYYGLLAVSKEVVNKRKEE